MNNTEEIMIEVSAAHKQMLDHLRQEHGGNIDVFLQQQVEEQIHQSHQETQYGGEE
jgi:hypothetical protein